MEVTRRSSNDTYALFSLLGWCFSSTGFHAMDSTTKHAPDSFFQTRPWWSPHTTSSLEILLCLLKSCSCSERTEGVSYLHWSHRPQKQKEKRNENERAEQATAIKIAMPLSWKLDLRPVDWSSWEFILDWAVSVIHRLNKVTGNLHLITCWESSRKKKDSSRNVLFCELNKQMVSTFVSEKWRIQDFGQGVKSPRARKEFKPFWGEKQENGSDQCPAWWWNLYNFGLQVGSRTQKILRKPN